MRMSGRCGMQFFLKVIPRAEEGEEDDEIKEFLKMCKKKMKNEQSPAEIALLVKNVIAELDAEEDAELEAKRVLCAQLEEELRAEKERSCMIAQLEEELRAEKERVCILMAQHKGIQDRQQQSTINNSRLQSKHNTILANCEKLAAEVTELRGMLSIQAQRKAETSAQLLTGARHTDEYQVDISKAFSRGMIQGMYEALQTLQQDFLPPRI